MNSFLLMSSGIHFKPKSYRNYSVVIRATMVIKLKEKQKKHRFYFVLQCAYVHRNDRSNFHETGLYRRAFIINLKITNHKNIPIP